jgi:hypothetical protein
LSATTTQDNAASSGPAAPKRVIGRPFRKGVSGNPSGRNLTSDVAALARQHTAAAIEALVAALKDPRTRVPAAIALLNRGQGMPVQPAAGDGPSSISLMHLIACKEVQAEIEHAMAARNGTAAVIDSTAETSAPAESIDLMKPALE